MATRGKIEEPLVWIDMEMTGLETKTDKILEVSCIVTDKHLEPVDSGITLVVHQPDEVLAKMNEWCKDTHGKVTYIIPPT